ncbi:MAG: hypothetical protein IKY18_00500 [Oscillospiraceae bacterium]|nr:hypothetical protein [Oscillospiraceae bacterium]
MEDMELKQPSPEQEDLKGKKFTACLAYLFWFAVIPMIYSTESKFIKYHANQGFVLATVETIYIIIMVIVSKLVLWPFSRAASLLVETTMFMVFVGVFGMLSLIGIFNVIRGKEKPIPTFGHIKLLK